MIRKSMIAAAYAASLFIVMPSNASADSYEYCLLKAGCFWQSDDFGGKWICSDPLIYMLCDPPQG